MTQREIAQIELQMKEHRVAYWEAYHKLPTCQEMALYFDDRLATI